MAQAFPEYGSWYFFFVQNLWPTIPQIKTSRTLVIVSYNIVHVHTCIRKYVCAYTQGVPQIFTNAIIEANKDVFIKWVIICVCNGKNWISQSSADVFIDDCHHRDIVDSDRWLTDGYQSWFPYGCVRRLNFLLEFSKLCRLCAVRCFLQVTQQDKFGFRGTGLNQAILEDT